MVLFFILIHLNIISLLIFYYFFHAFLSHSHLKILKNNKQTQNPSHRHCHPQPIAISNVHRPPLTQTKSTKFATKTFEKPTNITHKNNQNSTNPQIQQQKNPVTTNKKTHTTATANNNRQQQCHAKPGFNPTNPDHQHKPTNTNIVRSQS